MKRIFIDTDIGSDIDDALALLLALHLDDVEILGITTVYGPTDIRAKIVHKIVSAAGMDIPVAAGEGEPMGSLMPVWVAGTEGQGVLTEDEMDAPLDDLGIDTEATSLLSSQVLNHSGEVTLVALGALTNVARALVKEPLLLKSLHELVFMGGGLTYPKNPPTTLKEGEYYRAKHTHNVLCDMIAAREVLRSGIPMRLVTNDATCSCWLEGPGIDCFREAKTPPIQIVGRMLDIWLAYRSNLFGEPITGTCPHDALTLAAAVGRVQHKSARGDLTIDIDASTEFHLNDDSFLELIIAVDEEKFLPWLSERLHVHE